MMERGWDASQHLLGQRAEGPVRSDQLSAAKAGMHGFSKALAQEVGKKRHREHGCHPATSNGHGAGDETGDPASIVERFPGRLASTRDDRRVARPSRRRRTIAGATISTRVLQAMELLDDGLQDLRFHRPTMSGST